MATIFINHSEAYVRQIEAEIERLQQLRDQVQTTIQSEATLASSGSKTPLKRAMKKSAGKKARATKAPAKRGRPKSTPAAE
jgi:hypothetical protein